MNRESRLIVDDIEDSQFYKVLGLQMVRLSKGQCEMYLPVTDKALNHFGEVDQKVLYAVSDLACWAVTYTLIPQEQIPIHHSMNIALLSSASSAKGLTVAARAVESELGGLIEFSISTDYGKTVALGSIRYKGLEKYE